MVERDRGNGSSIKHDRSHQELNEGKNYINLEMRDMEAELEQDLEK